MRSSESDKNCFNIAQRTIRAFGSSDSQHRIGRDIICGCCAQLVEPPSSCIDIMYAGECNPFTDLDRILRRSPVDIVHQFALTPPFSGASPDALRSAIDDPSAMGSFAACIEHRAVIRICENAAPK